MSVFSGRSESTVNAIWRLLVRLALIAGIAYAYGNCDAHNHTEA